MNSTLLLELDEHGWAWLKARSADHTEEHGFALHAGFDVYHVWEAVLATGWVVRRDERFVLEQVSCRRLRDVTAEMFAHFERPHEPGPQLRQVARCLARLDLDPPLPADLSWWALAWLDVMVRDDLADAARSAELIWSDNELSLDVTRLRQQRWTELMARYEQSAAQPTSGRMAASYRRRRTPSAGGNERAG